MKYTVIAEMDDANRTIGIAVIELTQPPPVVESFKIPKLAYNPVRKMVDDLVNRELVDAPPVPAEGEDA